VTFEENPILLIVFIVLTVEGWNLAKVVARAAWQRRSRRRRLEPADAKAGRVKR
jgi:hypothetical protein